MPPRLPYLDEMADNRTLPEVDQALIVRPGDVLIVRVARDLNPKIHHDYQERLQALKSELPGIAKIVLFSGVDELAVLRP